MKMQKQNSIPLTYTSAGTGRTKTLRVREPPRHYPTNTITDEWMNLLRLTVDSRRDDHFQSFAPVSSVHQLIWEREKKGKNPFNHSPLRLTPGGRALHTAYSWRDTNKPSPILPNHFGSFVNYSVFRSVNQRVKWISAFQSIEWDESFK